MLKLQIRRRIAGLPLLRKSLFTLASRCLDLELPFRHDITHRRMFLNAWRHRGYWYYGKSRESDELEVIRGLVKTGYTVVEVGAHIGYLTQVFERYVGKEGNVIAVEPTLSSIYYLRKNVLPETLILPYAISGNNGTARFYCEQQGGFTNSLIKDWTTQVQQSQSRSNGTSVQPLIVQDVKVLCLESICQGLGLSIDFLKIDAEGAELEILKGSQSILSNIKSLMIEIAPENYCLVSEHLREYGFVEITRCNDNYFFLNTYK